MLERPDIDVVHIATPPHWHALISVAAAEAGKDVWCEKPMTRTIAEGRSVVRAVERNGRVFRVNTWFRFQDRFYGFGTDVKPIKKAVQGGLLGWPIKATVSAATGLRLEVLLDGPHQPGPRARPARARLRLLARPGALQALPPAPRPRHLPRLLGLRRRRPRGHGHALPRPGPVHPRQGRHEPGRGVGRRPAAAPRRLRHLAADRDEVRGRLHDRPRRGEPRPGRAVPRGPGGEDLPGLPVGHPALPGEGRRAARTPSRRSPTSPSPSARGGVSPSTRGTATAPARSSTWGRSRSSSGGRCATTRRTERFVDDEEANRLVEQPMRAPWRLPA